MKQFELGPVNKVDKNILIFATNRAGLNFFRHELEQNLKELKFEGYVLFDLLFSGNNCNRFVQLYFDGNTFIDTSFSIINNVDKQILELSAEFYGNNLHLLEYASLSKAEKFLIKHKKPLIPKPATWFIN